MHFFLGILIGSVMGLTGAGGALVAIPLFMQFLGMDLKEASVYSLIAVIIASLFNYLVQRRQAQFRTSLIIVLFSIVGSLLTSPIKIYIPEKVISLLIISISIFALLNVWIKKTYDQTTTHPHKLHWGMAIICGLTLGVLTTITGLGGGVLMVPGLIKFFHLNYKQAVASSLLAVCLSSFFSLYVQVIHGFNLVLDFNFFSLAGGILIAALALKYIASNISDKKSLLIQRVIYTIVVLFAWLKLTL